MTMYLQKQRSSERNEVRLLGRGGLLVSTALSSEVYHTVYSGTRSFLLFACPPPALIIRPAPTSKMNGQNAYTAPAGPSNSSSVTGDHVQPSQTQAQ
jgi:hypothetical protein